MIEFNGKTYASVEEMPPDVRRAYEEVLKMFADKNKDGTPDFLQEGTTTTKKEVKMVVSSSITVDGQTYASVEEMPPDVRQKYEEAAAKLQNLMGAAQGMGSASDAFPHQQQISVEAKEEISPPRQGTATRAPAPVMQEERPSTPALIALAILVLLALAVGSALVVWLLR